MNQLSSLLRRSSRKDSFINERLSKQNGFGNLGEKPNVTTTFKLKSEDKHHYVALRSEAPRLSCAPVLALDISKKDVEVFDGESFWKVERKSVADLLKNKPSKVFLESTGMYHRLVADCFLKEGVPVFEVNTRKLKRFRDQYSEDVKTDARDAEVIWHFGKTFKHKRVDVLSSHFEPLLRRHKIVSDVASKWKVFAESAKTAGEDDNVKLVVDQVKGLQAEKRKIIRELEKRLPEELCTEFGVLLSAVLLSFRPGRFPTSTRWASYLGFKLRQYESGSIVKPRRLSKRGNIEARKLLYLAVMCKIRYKREPIYSYYKKKKEKGKPGRVVMVACMRKLARRFWATVQLYPELQKQENECEQGNDDAGNHPLVGLA